MIKWDEKQKVDEKLLTRLKMLCYNQFVACKGTEYGGIPKSG